MPPLIGMSLLARSVLVMCRSVVVSRCLLVGTELFLLSTIMLFGIMLMAPTCVTPLLCSMPARGVATRESVLMVLLVPDLRTQLSIVPMTRTSITMTVLNGSVLLFLVLGVVPVPLTNYVTSETLAVVSSRQMRGLPNRVRNPPYPGMGGVDVSLPGLHRVSWCLVLVRSRLAPGLMLSDVVMVRVLVSDGLTRGGRRPRRLR